MIREINGDRFAFGVSDWVYPATALPGWVFTVCHVILKDGDPRPLQKIVNGCIGQELNPGFDMPPLVVKFCLLAAPCTLQNGHRCQFIAAMETK